MWELMKYSSITPVFVSGCVVCNSHRYGTSMQWVLRRSTLYYTCICKVVSLPLWQKCYKKDCLASRRAIETFWKKDERMSSNSYLLSSRCCLKLFQCYWFVQILKSCSTVSVIHCAMHVRNWIHVLKYMVFANLDYLSHYRNITLRFTHILYYCVNVLHLKIISKIWWRMIVWEWQDKLIVLGQIVHTFLVVISAL